MVDQVHGLLPASPEAQRPEASKYSEFGYEMYTPGLVGDWRGFGREGGPARCSEDLLLVQFRSLKQQSLESVIGQISASLSSKLRDLSRKDEHVLIVNRCQENLDYNRGAVSVLSSEACRQWEDFLGEWAKRRGVTVSTKVLSATLSAWGSPVNESHCVAVIEHFQSQIEKNQSPEQRNRALQPLAKLLLLEIHEVLGLHQWNQMPIDERNEILSKNMQALKPLFGLAYPQDVRFAPIREELSARRREEKDGKVDITEKDFLYEALLGAARLLSFGVEKGLIHHTEHAAVPVRRQQSAEVVLAA